MNILYLIDEIKVRGGTEKHLLALTKGMAKRGHHIWVYCLQEGEFANSFKMLGEKTKFSCLNVHKIYNTKGIAAIIKLSSILTKQRINIIQTFHTASDIIGPIAAKLSRNQTIVISSRRDLGFTKMPRHLKVQRFINKWVDGILANSHAVKDSVESQEGYSPKKITTIYNGIETTTLINKKDTGITDLNSEFSIPSNAIKIGTVGNLTKVKGHHILLDVAARICAEHQDVYFFIAGDGILRKELSDRVSCLNIQNRLFFLGNINYVPFFLQELDIYIHLSLSEGFSNAILESMAAGLSIIASKVGGNSEIIKNGKNGYLLEPNDVPGICHKINTLTTDHSKRKEMGTLNKRTTKNHFTMNNMFSHYDTFYSEMASKRLNKNA